MHAYAPFIGASQASLIYDPSANRFGLNLCTPLLNAGPGSGPTPSIGTTWMSYNVGGETHGGQQQVIYPARCGMYITDLQPRDFWETTLGFDVAPMLVTLKPPTPNPAHPITTDPMASPFHGRYAKGPVLLPKLADGVTNDTGFLFRAMCGLGLVSTGLYDGMVGDVSVGSSTPGMSIGADPLTAYSGDDPPATLSAMKFMEAQDVVPWVAARPPETADAGEFEIVVELGGFASGTHGQDWVCNGLIARVPKYYLNEGSFAYAAQINSLSSVYSGPDTVVSQMRVRVIDPLTKKAATIGGNSSVLIEIAH
jgi:hypothetical protein